MRPTVTLLALLSLATLAVACGPATTTPPKLAVVGTWSDGYGDTDTITQSTWRVSGNGSDETDTIVSFDNSKREAIIQTPASAKYNPDTFSKNLWTQPTAAGDWWLCTVDYGEKTAAAALNTTKTADQSHPDQGGCGSYPWSHMTSAK